MNAWTVTSRKNGLKILSSLFVFGFASVLFSSGATASTKIEFPTEELSQETVLPIFDQPTAVKRRIVPLENRVGIGIFGGLGLNDPFFSPIVFGGTLAYHFNNEYGIELLGSSYTHTPSQYVSGIKNASIQGTNSVCTNCPDFSYAPAVSGVYLASFKWSPFYGKISLTKSFVMNLITNFYGGLADVMVGDSSSIGGSVGLGQEFYFSSHFGLRADLRGLIFSGPAAVSRNALNPTTNPYTGANPPNSAYDQEMKFNILFDVGLVFLL